MLNNYHFMLTNLLTKNKSVDYTAIKKPEA